MTVQRLKNPARVLTIAAQPDVDRTADALRIAITLVETQLDVAGDVIVEHVRNDDAGILLTDATRLVCDERSHEVEALIDVRSRLHDLLIGLTE